MGWNWGHGVVEWAGEEKRQREKREREFNVGQVLTHNARDQSGQGRYYIEDLGIWVGKEGVGSHENQSSNG